MHNWCFTETDITCIIVSMQERWDHSFKNEQVRCHIIATFTFYNCSSQASAFQISVHLELNTYLECINFSLQLFKFWSTIDSELIKTSHSKTALHQRQFKLPTNCLFQRHLKQRLTGWLKDTNSAYILPYSVHILGIITLPLWCCCSLMGSKINNQNPLKHTFI